jgi:hypothetical protein
MDVDAETAVAWARTWWAETLLGGVGAAGVVLGATGDAVTALFGVVVLAATADRLRLRLDNRSLAAAVEEASERRVSAARRETTGDESEDERAAGGESTAG